MLKLTLVVLRLVGSVVQINLPSYRSGDNLRRQVKLYKPSILLTMLWWRGMPATYSCVANGHDAVAAYVPVLVPFDRRVGRIDCKADL